MTAEVYVLKKIFPNHTYFCSYPKHFIKTLKNGRTCKLKSSRLEKKKQWIQHIKLIFFKAETWNVHISFA